jgi:hypothetical protein
VAVAVLMNFDGGSNAAYDRVLEKMGLTDGHTPDHAQYHVAGETEVGGFRVVDVWDSAEEFQKFAEEQIGPLTAEEGFPPPKVDMWEVHNTLKAS